MYSSEKVRLPDNIFRTRLMPLLYISPTSKVKSAFRNAKEIHIIKIESLGL